MISADSKEPSPALAECVAEYVRFVASRQRARAELVDKLAQFGLEFVDESLRALGGAPRRDVWNVRVRDLRPPERGRIAKICTVLPLEPDPFGPTVGVIVYGALIEFRREGLGCAGTEEGGDG